MVANRYESYEAWRAVAAVGAGIAIGTMLAKPPAAATTVVVTGSSYYYHDNVFYTRVMSSGTVVYQVVAPPAGRSSRRSRRLHERDRRWRGVLAVRHDAITEGVDGL